MSTLLINGAKLYFEILGRKRTNFSRSENIPILLIHGSTNDGREDWGTLGPFLARKRPVIVPDCRGHGRSRNPHATYSFAEMAQDLAALLQALGIDRAHVIGHSNGGNVALVMLLEHPEVVQTAVLQAANAYVDKFLREREPGIFDPDRIAREAPEWLSSMKRMHDAHHGADYWRTLLALTLHETITEPNYTDQDLKRVERPTLVIQGELDPVNAPSRHGQFIASNIPYAEQWIARGIGHNVHHENPIEWIAKVENFIERRGDAANEVLYRLAQSAYADRRETIFDLHAFPVSGKTGKRRLRGTVLYAGQLSGAKIALADAGLEATIKETQVLLDEKTPWALVNRPVSDLREKPTRYSERLSQVLLGEVVRILAEAGEWSLVRVEHDAYLGWVLSAALHDCDPDQVRSFQSECRHRVQAEYLPRWDEIKETGDPARACGKLPFGVRVMVVGNKNDWAEIQFPDGKRSWVTAEGLLGVEHMPQPNAAGIEATLHLLRRFVGVPYLWGGRSSFGFDCSGLAGTFWSWLGVNLKRDADQQFQQGTPVEGTAQPGDLLFFGEPDPEHNKDRFSNVVHVAISLSGDRVLHATGSLNGTVYNSLDPKSPEYRSWLAETHIGTRRYTTC